MNAGESMCVTASVRWSVFNCQTATQLRMSVNERGGSIWEARANSRHSGARSHSRSKNGCGNDGGFPVVARTLVVLRRASTFGHDGQRSDRRPIHPTHTPSMPPPVAAAIGLAALQDAVALKMLQHVAAVDRSRIVAITKRRGVGDHHPGIGSRETIEAQRPQDHAHADHRRMPAQRRKQHAEHAAICECEGHHASQHLHLLARLMC